MQSNQQTHVALSASRGVIFVLTAALLWGTGGVVKQTIAELAPTNALSIAFFRMGFSVPVLGLVCALALRGAMLRIARRDLAITLFIGGLTGVYQAMYFGAISEVGVSIATLIALCVAPIVVADGPGWTFFPYFMAFLVLLAFMGWVAFRMKRAFDTVNPDRAGGSDPVGDSDL